ncbi:MAG: hypothetical protein WBK95_11170 [Sulfurimonas sp.]|nr:hypothetical protein [Sulfurimonas sp.]
MADYTLQNELKQILKQMGTLHYSQQFYCPLLKVLKMRHPDLDTHQANRLIKGLS